MYLGIMSIAEGVKSLQWIPGDACFSFHIMNAWEEGDVIGLDLMQYETPPLFPWPDGTPVNNGEAEGRFFRWSVNHNDAEPHLTCQQLSDVSGEFPVLMNALRANLTVTVGLAPTKQKVMQSACCLDWPITIIPLALPEPGSGTSRFRYLKAYLSRHPLMRVKVKAGSWLPSGLPRKTAANWLFLMR